MSSRLRTPLRLRRFSTPPGVEEFNSFNFSTPPESRSSTPSNFQLLRSWGVRLLQIFNSVFDSRLRTPGVQLRNRENFDVKLVKNILKILENFFCWTPGVGSWTLSNFQLLRSWGVRLLQIFDSSGVEEFNSFKFSTPFSTPNSELPEFDSEIGVGSSESAFYPFHPHFILFFVILSVLSFFCHFIHFVLVLSILSYWPFKAVNVQ